MLTPYLVQKLGIVTRVAHAINIITTTVTLFYPTVAVHSSNATGPPFILSLPGLHSNPKEYRLEPDDDDG